jgi:predicted RNase H-like HicB family nuclease
VDLMSEVRRALARRYLVIVERGPTSWGAYVPDLPICFAVGDTREEVERLIREAIEFHVEGLLEAGEPIPEPTTTPLEVEVTA